MANDTQSRKAVAMNNWRKQIQRMGWICQHWKYLQRPDRMFLMRKWKSDHPAEFYEVANEA